MTSRDVPRVRFVDQGPFRFILLDFAGISDTAEALAAVAEAKEFMARLTPSRTHYTLTDVRQSRYNRQIVDALKDLTVHNQPYVRAAAVVSDSALQRAVITMVGMFSRRKLAVFDTREAAIVHLASEDAATRQTS